MSGKIGRNLDYILVVDGEVFSGSLYRADAVSAAKTLVKGNPGARVRIYEGKETIYSYVSVDDDLPKADP